MTTVTVAEAKQNLRVIHASDDALIEQLISDAEDECLQYLNRDALPRKGAPYPDECDTAQVLEVASDADDLPGSLRRGILLIVQAGYEGKSPEEVQKIRAAAEVLWHPFRAHLGV
jgi:hypothetical protein